MNMGKIQPCQVIYCSSAICSVSKECTFCFNKLLENVAQLSLCTAVYRLESELPLPCLQCKVLLLTLGFLKVQTGDK